MVEIWQTEQARKCPTCNTFDWEWEEDPEAWTADVHWCLGCKSIEETRERVAREREKLPSEGFKLRLYRGKDDDGD